MKARFESRAIYGQTHTSVHKYKNLHNLPHWHMENELIYIEKGFAELMTGNNVYDMSEGMCAFVGSEDIHYIKGESDSVINVVKTDSYFTENIIGNKRLICPIMINKYSVKELMDEISEELSGKEYGGIIADSVAVRLIAEIFRTEETGVREDTRIANHKHKELLKLLADSFNHITFEEAAEFMNFSLPYFSKYFHKISGMTFTDYLNTLKVSSAVEKISREKMSMTEISIECGFGSIRNFNRIFKKFTGYSPKQLPRDYVFIHNARDISEKGFNPTLNSTEVLK